MKCIRGTRLFSLCGNTLMIAVLAAVGLVAAAEAQKTSKPPSPPPKPPLSLHPGNGSSSNADPSAPGFSAPYQTGWLYVHATNCYMYDSDGYTYVVVYPAEGGDFWTSSAPYQNLFLTACQTGNWIGLYIYDSNGDWSALYTYDYY